MTTTASLPTTLNAISSDWLTEVLCGTGCPRDGAVASVTVEQIGQGLGLLCHVARLTLTYEGEAACAPRTLVVKVPTSDPGARGLASSMGMYEREVRFYQEMACTTPASIPHCYFSGFDPGSGDCILLLEDLGDARPGDQVSGCSLADAEAAIDAIAAVHAAWWEHPHLNSFDWLPGANDPKVKAGLMLYPMAWPIFLERFGDRLTPLLRGAGEQLGGYLNAMLDRAATRPLTLCHVDFRLDNLLFGGAGRAPVTIIDWQAVASSVAAFDIGNFLSASLEPDVRRGHETELLRRYHGTLMERGVRGYSFDEFLADYRRALLLCFIVPVLAGGLGDLSNERGYALAANITDRVMAAVTDWDVLKLLDA